MALLKDSEIAAKLGQLPEWKRSGDEIVREYRFDGFVGSVEFVDRVVGPAEEMGHHPDIAISWNTVTVSISTHSQGGLTAADFELAAKLDTVA